MQNYLVYFIQNNGFKCFYKKRLPFETTLDRNSASLLSKNDAEKLTMQFNCDPNTQWFCEQF